MDLGEQKIYTKKRYCTRVVALLPDSYIANLLNRWSLNPTPIGDIPKELIELKRIQLLLRRKARGINYEVPLTMAELAASKPTKYCMLCKTEKGRSAFGIDNTGKYRDGLRNCCKECRKLETARHSEAKKVYDKIHYCENFERISKRNSEYGKRNRKKLNVQSNEYRRKGREELSNIYIKNLLNDGLAYKLKLKDVPQTLIEAKRLQLMIWRITNENSNATTK